MPNMMVEDGMTGTRDERSDNAHGLPRASLAGGIFTWDISPSGCSLSPLLCHLSAIVALVRIVPLIFFSTVATRCLDWSRPVKPSQGLVKPSQKQNNQLAFRNL